MDGSFRWKWIDVGEVNPMTTCVNYRLYVQQKVYGCQYLHWFIIIRLCSGYGIRMDDCRYSAPLIQLRMKTWTLVLFVKNSRFKHWTPISKLRQILKQIEISYTKRPNTENYFSRDEKCSFIVHSFTILLSSQSIFCLHSTAQEYWIQLLKNVLNKLASEQSWLTQGMSPSYCSNNELKQGLWKTCFLKAPKTFTSKATHGAPHSFPSFLVSPSSSHSSLSQLFSLVCLTTSAVLQ